MIFSSIFGVHHHRDCPGVSPLSLVFVENIDGGIFQLLLWNLSNSSSVDNDTGQSLSEGKFATDGHSNIPTITRPGPAAIPIAEEHIHAIFQRQHRGLN